jgi:beta-glucanase (GH16 family)
MLRHTLIASASVLLCATASAQTTFNSTSMAMWPTGWSWAPNGHIASDMSSWIPGTAGTPADAKTVSEVSGVLTLSIIPRPADLSTSAAGGANLVGAVVSTRDTFSQTYGCFSMVAQMPNVNGTMGAFYLNATDGSWPPEFDIVEALARTPTQLSITLHTKDQSAQINTLVPVPDMTRDFHTYAVDWEASTITGYFDGKAVYQTATPSDMHQPMYMILDAMSGAPGSWEGAPSSNSVTTSMIVKSVTVQAGGCDTATTPAITPSAGTPQPAVQSDPQPAAAQPEPVIIEPDTAVLPVEAPQPADQAQPQKRHRHRDPLWFERDSDHEHAWRKDHDHPDQ